MVDNVAVLTKCPSNAFRSVAEQKKAWWDRYFDSPYQLIAAPSSCNKSLYMQKDGDILVDDYGKNIKEWIAAGGVGIKHEGTQLSLLELQKLV